MMVHQIQIAEKLTASVIQESAAKKQGASEEGAQGSGFFKADAQIPSTCVNRTKGNNLRSEGQQELYIQIKDEVADEIIKHGLSKVESKLFFYFLKLDRFGDRPVKVKVAEILLATGIGKSAYHLAIAKFEAKGWFGFTHGDVEISNFCTPTKKSKKTDSQSEKMDSQSEKMDSQSEKMDSQSEKTDSEKLKPLPPGASKTPQTLQTYSNLLQTLPEEQRESFKKFCLKKIEECSFKIGSKESWLNKHGAEYLEEFKETYSEALTNPQVIAPRATQIDTPDIPYLKRIYRERWRDAAIHFGLIDPNSPEEENEDGSEGVQIRLSNEL
jgi:hypothetical protein